MMMSVSKAEDVYVTYGSVKGNLKQNTIFEMIEVR